MSKSTMMAVLVIAAGLMSLVVLDDTNRNDWIARCILSQPAETSYANLKDICWAMERQR